MGFDEASNTYGRGTYTNFGRKYPKKRYHLEHTHSDERMNKQYTIKKKWRTNAWTGHI